MPAHLIRDYRRSGVRTQRVAVAALQDDKLLALTTHRRETGANVLLPRSRELSCDHDRLVEAILTADLAEAEPWTSLITRVESNNFTDVSKRRQIASTRQAWTPLVRDRSGLPVTWRADQDIRYAVNPSLGYSGFVDDVVQVMIEVRRFTGLPFCFAGSTSLTRDAFEAGEGPRDLSILAAWLPNQEDLRSPTPAIAVGPSRSHFDHEVGREVRYTAQMLFWAGYHLQSGFGANTWGSVIRHEAGHVVGLDHPASRLQIMSPASYNTIADWGSGDVAGLKQLGAIAARAVSSAGAAA